ncbi:MAG: CobW/HypB/UreG, nucleotide-binding domain-containing protein [Monoraphidium minutum]|nr:MAG: CobW/HypB/UreG, nucleotide-binding domain-containing protein [Monoraphidium minutum]
MSSVSVVLGTLISAAIAAVSFWEQQRQLIWRVEQLAAEQELQRNKVELQIMELQLSQQQSFQQLSAEIRAPDAAIDAVAPPPPPRAAAAPRAPVPVTLITGFLGAGKTTLVRHILTARHGRRIAVILNEFGGEGDIERAFVRGERGDSAAVPQWVELANGCLCCSVKAEFLQARMVFVFALEALVAPGSAHEGRFDAVLIETTGLADPGPIIGELWSDEELEPAVSLDGVVTVVDAAHVGRQLAEPRPRGAANEAQLQVAMADVVLLNKVDLVSEEHLRQTEVRLRAINAAARLVRCERAAVDPAALFGTGGYRLRDASGAPLLARGGGGGGEGPLPGFEAAAAAGGSESAACSAVGCADPSHGHGHGHEHHGGGGSAAPCASHDDSIRTVVLRCEAPLPMARFTSWLEGLLWAGCGGGGGGGGGEQGGHGAGGGEASSGGQVGGGGGGSEAGSGGGGPEVLRLKGLVDVAGSENAHMVQAVYEVYDVVAGPPWARLQEQWADEARDRAAQQQRQQQQEQQPVAAAGRATRLVVIGRRLDRAALQRGLEAAAAAGADAGADARAGADAGA